MVPLRYPQDMGNITMTLQTAFKVLAHEIRSPAGVITGYTRLLRDGRLDAAGQLDALTQIDRAADRMAQFGRQAAELGAWLEPRTTTTPDVMKVSAVIDGAVRTTASPDHVTTSAAAGAGALHVSALNRDALLMAIGALIEATAREVKTLGGAVHLAARVDAPSASCELLCGPAAQLAAADKVAQVPGPDHADPFDIDRGGLGLQLILGAVVLETHGATLWSTGGRQGIVGVRLPIHSEART